jgi:hypothetical protein
MTDPGAIDQVEAVLLFALQVGQDAAELALDPDVGEELLLAQVDPDLAGQEVDAAALGEFRGAHPVLKGAEVRHPPGNDHVFRVLNHDPAHERLPPTPASAPRWAAARP